MHRVLKAFSVPTDLDAKSTTLVAFLKSKNLFVELLPLNSKGRKEQEGKLLKEALKSWFVPTEMIRDYYGDEVAMYFSWMNFFIKWLAVPGILSLILTIVNSYTWELAHSPLNSIYSILIVFWSTLFVIFWKRR